MVTLHRVHLQTLLVFSFLVHLSTPVCVDVGSDTEAVLGGTMRLTCISCLKREEMKGITTVEWYFTSKNPENNTSSKTKIFKRRNEDEWNEDEHFNGRLSWFGSKDMQNLSLQIQNVSERDHGFYECHVTREFDFGEFSHRAFTKKNFTLTVKEKASKDTTAIYSEIMMYVLLVFLTLWLLVEMVYCYRKISKSDEQAQDTATNYLAVPSEQKDNPVTSVTE